MEESHESNKVVMKVKEESLFKYNSSCQTILTDSSFFTTMEQVLDEIEECTNRYVLSVGKKERKKIGQFFTDKKIARYMASLFYFDSDKEIIYVLDPGAGTGMLSAAFIERAQSYKHIKKIILVCYENDDEVLPILRKNLHNIADASHIQVEYEIIKNNYILDQALMYTMQSEKERGFDYIICNPPYMKLGKHALEAQIMSDVCYGSPNLYALFVTMGIFNSKEEGQLVYIIPRSWTSGAYFKKFRNRLISESRLEHIHLFIHREGVFKDDAILQETVIIKIRKSRKNYPYVEISTSLKEELLQEGKSISVPYDEVVHPRNGYVFLITSEEDKKIIHLISTMKHTLIDVGLRMKTGLTVAFREKSLLRDIKDDSDTMVPLLQAQHIKNGAVEFPQGKGHEYILVSKKGLLQENTNYVFVKRFTSKEEKRRLQAAVYLSEQLKRYSKISTENKINFICGEGNLSREVIYGVFVIFNSTIYDRYYRILNGSTQVNATEINCMPIPDLKSIEWLGKQYLKSSDISSSYCDELIRRVVYESSRGS